MKSKCRKSWEWGAMQRVVLTAFFAVCLVVVLLPNPALAEDYPTSGTCGERVTWSYVPVPGEYGIDQGGTLTISGEGPMEDYNTSSVPWRWNIKEVIIENGVTRIGQYAFTSCSLLGNVDIPESVTSIGSSAFNGCRNLTNIRIPDGVTNLEDSAFYGTSLATVFIPSCVIRMDRAFDGCNSLREINVADSNTHYASVNGVVFNKEKTTLLFCPRGKTSYSIPDGVTAIDGLAFHNCSKLTSVVIPNSVTEIEYSAFNDCSSLTNIVIPNKVDTISSGVFSGCSKLETVYLPAGLKQISSDAFKDCANLKTIHFAGSQAQWDRISIRDDNQEIRLANVICNSAPGSSDDPSGDPDTPSAPDTLSLSVSSGGLGRKVTVQVDGGHWLTLLTRRAGSVSITAVQAPGSGRVTLAFSAAAGSSIQVWETAEEMTFSSQGVPNNTILATASRTL